MFLNDQRMIVVFFPVNLLKKNGEKYWAPFYNIGSSLIGLSSSASYCCYCQLLSLICSVTLNVRVTGRVARWFVFKPNLGKLWRVLQWKMLVYVNNTWSILRSFLKFYGHFVKFVVIWCIFPRFGILYKEKSGNPGHRQLLMKKNIITIMKCQGLSLLNIFKKRLRIN
jgi:hypothetical protein